MRAIWKFVLETGSFGISMPFGAKILRVDNQEGVPSVWAEVETEAEKEVRKFLVVGTGEEIPPEAGPYVGTFTSNGGERVWHLYEVMREVDR